MDTRYFGQLESYKPTFTLKETLMSIHTSVRFIEARISDLVDEMLPQKCNIGTIRPRVLALPNSLPIARRWTHTNNDIRATLLSAHPELSEKTTRKKIMEQYTSACARLSIRQNTELVKIRLPQSEPEQFVRLRAKAIAARHLEGEGSDQLLRQYQVCEVWLEKNTPNIEQMCEAEKRVVLQRFPSLAASPVREYVVKQYNAELARIVVQSEGPCIQPRQFVDGTWFAERQKFAELELQCVAVRLLENDMPSKSALEEWKNEFNVHQKALKNASVLSIEEERKESLRRHPDLEDPEVRRAVFEDTTKSFELLRKAESNKKAIPPAIRKQFLELVLKSLDAQTLQPDGGDARRMKDRHQLRADALADLTLLKADKAKGGWWIIPNPLALLDWIPI